MKALKVIASIILGCVMFVAALVFGVLTTMRIFFSAGSMGKMIEQAAEENGKISLNGVDKNSSDVGIEDLQKAIDVLDGYVSKKEIYKEFGIFSSDLVKYYFGAKDEVSSKSLKRLLEKVEKKYKEETNSTVNFDELYRMIDQSVVEAKNSIKNMDADDEQAMQFIGLAFNNGVYAGILVAFFVCGLLIFLVNKNIKPVCIHLAIVTILCALANFGMSGVAKKIDTNDLMGEIISKTMQKDFMITALAFIIIAVVAIIIAATKKNKNVITA